jgi:hypothetical protein
MEQDVRGEALARLKQLFVECGLSEGMSRCYRADWRNEGVVYILVADWPDERTLQPLYGEKGNEVLAALEKLGIPRAEMSNPRWRNGRAKWWYTFRVNVSVQGFEAVFPKEKRSVSPVEIAERPSGLV